MTAARVGKNLSGTQVKSTSGTPASSVVCQSGHSMARGKRYDPPSGPAQLVGKGLANADTRNSSMVQDQNVSTEVDVPRGKRRDPVSHAQLPGKGLRNTQTRNSPVSLLKSGTRKPVDPNESMERKSTE